MASKRAGMHKIMRRHFLESLGIRDGHGWTCFYCRTALRDYGDNEHPNSPAIEHRVPLSRGGSDEMSNLRLACKACNTKKGTKTDVEYTGMPELAQRLTPSGASDLTLELEMEHRVELYHAVKRVRDLLYPRVTAVEPISDRTIKMRTERINKNGW